MPAKQKFAWKLLFTLIDMFLCGEASGKTFRRAETPIGGNFSASGYLNRICIFVLKFEGLKPFWGCFLRGVFGVQKRFCGGQSDDEVAAFYGYVHV